MIFITDISPACDSFKMSQKKKTVSENKFNEISMTSEKCSSLRWNDFESNISSAFEEICDDEDFFNVTLACDDEQIQAHKVIFFRNILQCNPHQHPLLYLKGVKYTDLQSVHSFM